MSRLNIYQLLEFPAVFRMVQGLVAPGAEADLLELLGPVFAELPKAARILDVGCGPSSWLWKLGMDPVGVDVSPSYVKAFKSAGGIAHLGSADELPFPDKSFDAVWSFALFHHLDEATAQRTLSEMARVCCRPGYLFIFDSVMPETPWKRPFAWAVRRLDRGEHVRSQTELERLLPDRKSWEVRRIEYARTGLEGAFLIRNFTE